MQIGDAPVDDEQRYAQARKRVQELKGFYTHATVFVLVNVVLIVIDVATGSGWWFFWPLLGWGIGLTAHGVNIFGISGRFGSDWEERKIRELMDKNQRSQD